MKDVIRVLSDYAPLFGLVDGKPKDDDNNHWYGIAAPILAYSSIHEDRAKELRLGHATMTIKRNSIPITIRWSIVPDYGLSTIHHILLEGISFSPAKKSSMAHSLGPATKLLQQIRYGAQPTYGSKWKTAVSRTFKGLPGLDDIIEYLAGQSIDNLGQIPFLMCSIIALAGCRNANRASFPFCVIVSHVMNAAEIKHYAGAWAQDGFHLPNVKSPSEQQFEIDYSGKNMWPLYISANNKDWVLPGKLTKEQASQVVFHSIFGTYREDLSILEQVTNVQNWQTRSEVGSNFRGKGTSTTTVTFQLPKMMFISKLSSAATTNLLARQETQAHIRTVLAGTRVQTVSKSFIDAVQQPYRPVRTSIKSQRDIEASLSSEFERIVYELSHTGGQITMGTVPWVDIKDIDKWKKNEDLEERTFEGKGKFWLESLS